MREVANESYELIRGVLETLHPALPPHLANLLLNQIRSIADHSKSAYKFIEQGQPRLLTPDAMRQVFFAFLEAIRNVDKHANAQNIEVSLVWGDDELNLSIRDDGRGLNPESQWRNAHFGLEIMRERIEALGGSFSIQTGSGDGTRVAFLLPLKAIQEMV